VGAFDKRRFLSVKRMLQFVGKAVAKRTEISGGDAKSMLL
jgi:hypothetical protein